MNSILIHYWHKYYSLCPLRYQDDIILTQEYKTKQKYNYTGGYDSNLLVHLHTFLGKDQW